MGTVSRPRQINRMTAEWQQLGDDFENSGSEHCRLRISDFLDIKFDTAVRELLKPPFAGLPNASGHPSMTGDCARAEARL